MGVSNQYNIVELARYNINTNHYRVWGYAVKNNSIFTVLRTAADTTGDIMIKITPTTINTVYQDDDFGMHEYLHIFNKIIISAFGQCCPITNAGIIFRFYPTSAPTNEFDKFDDTHTDVANPNNDNNYGRFIYDIASNNLIVAGTNTSNHIRVININDMINATTLPPIKYILVSNPTKGRNTYIHTIGNDLYIISGTMRTSTADLPFTIDRVLLDDVINAADHSIISNLPSFINIFTDNTKELLGVGGEFVINGKTIIRLRDKTTGTTSFYMVDLLNGTVTDLGVPSDSSLYNPTLVSNAYGEFMVIDDNGNVNLVDINGNITPIGSIPIHRARLNVNNVIYTAVYAYGNIILMIDRVSKQLVIYGIEKNGFIPGISILNNNIDVIDIRTGQPITGARILVSNIRAGGNQDIVNPVSIQTPVSINQIYQPGTVASIIADSQSVSVA